MDHSMIIAECMQVGGLTDEMSQGRVDLYLYDCRGYHRFVRYDSPQPYGKMALSGSRG